MPAAKFQRGEKVMGRWPGSSLFYEVKVLDFDSSSRQYTVIYKDGTELELRENDVMNLAGFQSRSRSPGRRRSRSRSRSRSPGRTARRSTSRSRSAATGVAVESSVGAAPRRDTRLKDTLEVRLSPLQLKKRSDSNSNGPESAAETRAPRKTSQAGPDPATSQGRYNLRRRREDGGTTPDTKKGGIKEAAGEAPPTSFVPAQGSTIASLLWILLPSPWVLLLILHLQQEDPSLSSRNLRPLPELWDPPALGGLLLWLLFQALIYLLPLGGISEGPALSSGKKLKYRTNGVLAAVLTGMAMFLSVWGGADLSLLHKHFLQLAAGGALIALSLSVLLYLKSSFTPPHERTQEGNTGNVLHDLVRGRELNPRLGNLDIKLFCETRPGLLGWVVLNLGLAVAQMKLHGSPVPSPSMMMVIVFQLIYVLDSLWHEEDLLSSMDLHSRGFGLLASFSSLLWIPFTSCLQALYLVGRPRPVDTPVLVASAVLQAVGYYIYRKSNCERSAFRKNPADPRLSNVKTIPTATGKSLLVSGWWAVVRHPNYLGDLLMVAAWTLPCGFTHLLPWHQLISFVLLLLLRDAQVSGSCCRRYGAAWEQYCCAVPYRIIPGLY